MLEAYKQRKLLLIGKITIFKIQDVHNLVYLLKVLPSPSQGLVKRIKNDLLYLFGIMENQGYHYHSLRKDIPDESLKLTNITVLDLAVKFSWISLLVSNSG